MGALLPSGCEGVVPLPARWEEWQLDLCRSGRLAGWLRRHGSPLNLHRPAPMLDNADELLAAGERAGVAVELFFARKANKCLAYVEAARDAGLGVDVASHGELTQSLDAGLPAERIVLTAAVKSGELLALAAERGVLVVLDNEEEAARLAALARAAGRSVPVALRLSGFRCGGERLDSRFGFDVEEGEAVAARLLAARGTPLRLDGLHFHLDGYDWHHRAAALDRCLALADRLAAAGARLRFVDAGGGLPMSYLPRAAPWARFWRQLGRALTGERQPITWRNHGYGLVAAGGAVVGTPHAYPHHQRPTGAAWLDRVLAARREDAGSGGGETIAQALADRRLALRLEPGRSLLDGCGLTAAEVVHVKRHPDGSLLLGLAMNGSQCRSRKSELFADPLLLRPARGAEAGNAGGEGYLTGAWCAEDDLVSHRRFRFPHGARAGDVVVFPNTAGYLMHFVESRSHQLPLARNLVLGESGAEPRLDPID